MKLLFRILPLSLVLLVPAARVSAHAFLEHSDPSVGSKVHSAPAAVRIWFTEAIEPRFSSIQVFDPAGKQVDRKDTHSDPSNRSVLQVSLSRLRPGSYKVLWRIVSVDTHRTNGDFTFQIVP
jgi:hypothetical protein